MKTNRASGQVSIDDGHLKMQTPVVEIKSKKKPSNKPPKESNKTNNKPIVVEEKPETANPS